MNNLLVNQTRWYNKSMPDLFKSASKNVFMLLAVALVVLTFIGAVEAKDFITLTSMAFTYYFATKTPSGTNL